MKKILIRAHTNIMKTHHIKEVLSKDLYGHNPGNWLFLYGVLRTIVTDDVKVDFINGYAENLNPKKINRINKEYDYFILPLANIFKNDWIDKLKSLTYIVKSLAIPSIVIGVGVQANLNETKFDYEFNTVAKDFIDAVLEKSNMIGVRGEYTAQYFEKLGYKREKDFTIIGCPSMYSFGINLPHIHKVEIPNKFILNSNPDILDNNYNKMYEQVVNTLKETHSEYYYIPQRLDELRQIYIGSPLVNRIQEFPFEYYPNDITKELYSHEIGINSFHAWYEFNKGVDFVFGARIHGSIMSILSGVPTLVIAKDSRVLELAEYHHIPYIRIDEIADNIDIFQLYNEIDFSDLYEHHKDNFYKFLNFLQLNNVSHIYEKDVNRFDAPLDHMIEISDDDIYYPLVLRDKFEVQTTQKEYIEYLHSYTRLSHINFRKNILNLYTEYDRKKAILNKKNLEITDLNNQNKRLNKKLKKYDSIYFTFKHFIYLILKKIGLKK